MAKVIHVSMVRQVSVVGRSLAAALVMSGAVTWARVSLFDAPVHDFAGLLIQAGILSSLGAVVYLAAHAGLWIAANRPQGIEHQVSARFSALSPA